MQHFFYDQGMTNPAGTLYDIFTSWTIQGDVVSSRSQGNGRVSMEQHVLAMKCIWDINLIVKRWESDGQPVEIWYEAINAWSLYVVSYYSPWYGQFSSAADSRKDARVELLFALRQLLDTTEPSVPAEAVADLDGFLDDIVGLLGEDAGLSPELRAYILQLVQEIRSALETFHVTGRFDATDALRRLWLATGAAAAESDGETTRWTAFRDRIAVPAAAGFLSGLPALSTDVVLAITQGG